MLPLIIVGCCKNIEGRRNGNKLIPNIMAGIYIHIPYCRKACHYCNFHFSTSLQTKNEFVEALLKEIEIRKDFLEGQPINTVYFGGGTPSLLSSGELERILQKVNNLFGIEATAEITLEANPDDIESTRVMDWHALGINRLSIGIQSFFKEDLLWMNRAHDEVQALRCIEIAQSKGISNLTIDLIYGTPTLTDEKWSQNIHRAVSLGIPHLSCYALTVEPKTALDARIRKHQIQDIDPGKQANQFLQLMETMNQHGFEHYEISNFAKPGFRSRHNSAYWNGAHYLGLGPSAHSFNGTSRQWNISNNSLYIKSILEGKLNEEKEILTPVQQANEYIMTSLRTMEGLDLNYLKNQFGEELSNNVIKTAEQFIRTSKLIRSNNRLVLTNEGKLFADGIASELFM